jgi:hypothetical protein
LGSKLTEYYAKIDTKKEEKNVRSKSPLKLMLNKPGGGGSFGQQQMQEDTSIASKWKMMFSKDERKPMPQGNSAAIEANLQQQQQLQLQIQQQQQLLQQKLIPKQYAFGNESDSDTEKPNFGAPKHSAKQHSPRRSAPRTFDNRGNRRRTPPPAQVRSGPIVLDKFGCFRLAVPAVQATSEFVGFNFK